MGISSLPDFKGNIVKHMFDMQKPQMKIFTFLLPLVLLRAKLTTTMTLILLICHSGILGILESVEKNLDLAGFWFDSGSMRKHYRLSSNFPQLDYLGLS